MIKADMNTKPNGSETLQKYCLSSLVSNTILLTIQSTITFLNFICMTLMDMEAHFYSKKSAKSLHYKNAIITNMYWGIRSHYQRQIHSIVFIQSIASYIITFLCDIYIILCIKKLKKRTLFIHKLQLFTIIDLTFLFYIIYDAFTECKVHYKCSINLHCTNILILLLYNIDVIGQLYQHLSL